MELGSVWSNNIWADFLPLNSILMFEGVTIFRIIDHSVVNNLIPTSAFFITILVGWVMSREATCYELGLEESGGCKLWRTVVRSVAPTSIFLDAIGTVLG